MHKPKDFYSALCILPFDSHKILFLLCFQLAPFNAGTTLGMLSPLNKENIFF